MHNFVKVHNNHIFFTMLSFPLLGHTLGMHDLFIVQWDIFIVLSYSLTMSNFICYLIHGREGVYINKKGNTQLIKMIQDEMFPWKFSQGFMLFIYNEKRSSIQTLTMKTSHKRTYEINLWNEETLLDTCIQFMLTLSILFKKIILFLTMNGLILILMNVKFGH